MDEDEKIEAGSLKWQAGPGLLFCKKLMYNPNPSELILPGDASKIMVFKVISVGPDVVGFNEGDIVGSPQAHSLEGKSSKIWFVHAKTVLGRLVPKSAPNSAQAVRSTNGASEA